MKKQNGLKIFAIVISILVVWICTSTYIQESDRKARISKYQHNLVESLKNYNFIDSIIAEPEKMNERDSTYQLIIIGNSSFDKMSNDQKVIKLEEIREIFLRKLLEYIYEEPDNKEMDDMQKMQYEIGFATRGAEIIVETERGKYINRYNILTLPDKTDYVYIPPVSEHEYKLALIAEYIDNEISARLIKNKYNDEQLIKYEVFKEAKHKFNALDGDIWYAWNDYSDKYPNIINRWEKEHKIK